MNHISYSYAIIILLLLFLVSCGEQSNEGERVVHPVKEKIPHSDVSAKMLEVFDAGNYLDELPKSVQVLHHILNDSTTEQNSRELNIITTDRLDISDLKDSTLLILEKDKNRLIHYDLATNKPTVVAEKGRGPGDLDFSKELSVNNGKAYVGMQGYQISVFNCKSGTCEHESVIKTDFNIYSLSPTNNHIYFLGIVPFGREQNPDPENTDQFTIHRANLDGEVDQSFLPVYKSEIPEVRNRMMSSGEVRTYPQFGKTLVTLASLPFLYTYDSTGELLTKYEYPDYIESFGYSSVKEKGGGWTTRISYDGDYTRLAYSSKLNEQWLLLKVKEYRGIKMILTESRSEGEIWVSYYALNIGNDKFYKIGDDNVYDYPETRMLHVVGSGVISNEEGKLYWVN